MDAAGSWLLIVGWELVPPNARTALRFRSILGREHTSSKRRTISVDFCMNVSALGRRRPLEECSKGKLRRDRRSREDGEGLARTAKLATDEHPSTILTSMLVMPSLFLYFYCSYC